MSKGAKLPPPRPRRLAKYAPAPSRFPKPRLGGPPEPDAVVELPSRPERPPIASLAAVQRRRDQHLRAAFAADSEVKRRTQYGSTPTAIRQASSKAAHHRRIANQCNHLLQEVY